MSDGDLSKEEVEALLDGEGKTGGGTDVQALSDLFAGLKDSHKATLSGVLAQDVEASFIGIESLSRKAFLDSVDDEIVEIKSDFNKGVNGGHVFVMSGPDALKFAAPMVGEEEQELSETVISALGEAISQLMGAALNTLTEKLGTDVMTAPQEGQQIAKGLLSIGEDEVVVASYTISVGGNDIKLMEVMEPGVAQSLKAFIDSPPNGDEPSLEGGGSSLNLSASDEAFLTTGEVAPPNVQGIQYPELDQGISPSEQRNIGLLMDVSMELTVELGRTKWQIRDILSIGEGTIIELDKLAGEPVDILVNGNPIAKGEVVVIDENFGVRITEIISNLDKVKG